MQQTYDDWILAASGVAYWEQSCNALNLLAPSYVPRTGSTCLYRHRHPMIRRHIQGTCVFYSFTTLLQT